MNIRPKSQIISVRVDTDTLEAIDNLLPNSNISRNALINEMLQSFLIEKIKENKANDIFDIISLTDNVTKLGFQKSFLSREDAVLVHYGVTQIIKEQDQFFKLLGESSDEKIEKEIQTIELTGVKYSFLKAGIILFSVFDFYEDRDDVGNSILTSTPLLYKYDLKNNIFESYSEYDFFPFSIDENIDWAEKYEKLKNDIK